MASAIGGLIGGIGSIIGGNTAANAAKQAAQMQMQMYNKTAGYEQPFMSAGTNALGIYGNATGQNGTAAEQNYWDNFKLDPYMQALKGQGEQGVMNSALAKGRGYGGNTLSDLYNYDTGVFNTAAQQRLGNLFQTAQLGANATNALAGAGTTAANNAGNYLTAGGAYQGAGYVNAGNAFGKGYQNFNQANPNFGSQVSNFIGL